MSINYWLAADGTLAMITMAPELPGADAALARFTAAGVTVAFGHSDADATIAADAVAGGATVVTHLFNAMRPIHHRDPGPIPRLLTDPGPMLEMISDGFHLHPDVVLMIIATAGPDRVALITDAFAGAGMPDGEFRLGALRVALRDGQAHLINPDGSLGAIASSTLTMAAAVRFLVGHGVPVPDVARMAATTPARGHRLVGAGVVEPGAGPISACSTTREMLQRVLHRGEWVEPLMLARLTELLAPAASAGRAVGAFNVFSLEHAEAIVSGAERVGLPVVLQISQNAVRYHGALEPILGATLALARTAGSRPWCTSITPPTPTWSDTRSSWASPR